MHNWRYVAQVAAFVCFTLATFGYGGRFNLIAAGLALWGMTAVL